eukprot:tig00021589_g22723.t1
MALQLIPPFRFAQVEEGVFRGAYPTVKNFRFLKRLKLRTIISVIPNPPTRELLEFCERHGITNLLFTVEKFNESVNIAPTTVAHILETLVDRVRQPVFIHCLDGSHNTGLIIMCLRKLQNWALSVIYSEFCRYTKGGEILRDESLFVESFKGELSVPEEVPRWLWGGVRITRHPTIRLKPLPSQANLAPAPKSSPAPIELLVPPTAASPFRGGAGSGPEGEDEEEALLSEAMQALALEGLPSADSRGRWRPLPAVGAPCSTPHSPSSTARGTPAPAGDALGNRPSAASRQRSLSVSSLQRFSRELPWPVP